MNFKWLWLRFLPKSVFIWKGRPSSRRIALTLDDGPYKDTTEDLLNILRKTKVAATFFLSGSQIAQNPDLLLRIHGEGHEIGNHSYTHRPLSELSLKEIVNELALTQDIIRKNVGCYPKLFRPPYGDLSLKVILAALKCKLTTVLWTVDPRDYSLDTPSDVIENLRGTEFRGGEIVLFHTHSYATLSALPDIIKDFRNQGIEMTSVSHVI